MRRPSPTPSLRPKGFSILPRATIAVALAVGVFAGGGCGGSGSGVATSRAPGLQTPAPSPAPSFPALVRDDEGTQLTLPRGAERIVSLSPASTETVFALGKGQNLLAGSAFDDYPPEAKQLPDVATFDQGVLVERVVELRPDLVLAGGNNFTPPRDIQRMRKLGIPVVVLYAETVDEVLADIRLIGLAIGAPEDARRMTQAMKDRIDVIASAAAATGSRPRVFYEIGDQPDTYGPADDSFIVDLVSRAGGEPITTGSTTSYTMPLERLVAADPEIIVLGDASYGVTPEAVRKRTGAWRSITAVKSGVIRPVDDIVITRPGPRLADGFEQLARAIHPDLALQSPASASPSK